VGASTNGRIPRYLQIADSLRQKIQAGTLLPGHRLPSQRALARESGVTLMTLRQALELLERERLITQRHGLGTFVASPSIDYDIRELRGFAGDLTALGERVETKLLRSHFALPDRRVATGLGLAGGAAVFIIERLRLVNGQPMSYQRSFLPSSVGEEVAKADLALHSLRHILSFKLGVDIVSARETVSAVRLGSREAREFRCQPGSPAFCSERVSFSADHAPVVFDRAYIPGDRFRITRQLRYEVPAP
jgi:GntR family transcriptional regulator